MVRYFGDCGVCKVFLKEGKPVELLNDSTAPCFYAWLRVKRNVKNHLNGTKDFPLHKSNQKNLERDGARISGFELLFTTFLGKKRTALTYV